MKVRIYEAKEPEPEHLNLILRKAGDGVDLVGVDGDGNELGLGCVILSLDDTGIVTLYSGVAEEAGLVLDNKGHVKTVKELE